MRGLRAKVDSVNAHEVSLGSARWPSKRALFRHALGVRRKYLSRAATERVELNEEDREWFRRLIVEHHNSAFWRDQIQYMTAAYFGPSVEHKGGIHFYAKLCPIEEDGSPGTERIEKVGISNCFRTEDEKRARVLRQAVRDAIKTRLDAVRLTAFGVPPQQISCPRTGRPMNIRSKTTVEHVGPSLDQIWIAFLTQAGIVEDDIPLGEGYGARAIPTALRAAWQDFHRAHTPPGSLQLVLKMSATRDGEEVKTKRRTTRPKRPDWVTGRADNEDEEGSSKKRDQTPSWVNAMMERE